MNSVSQSVNHSDVFSSCWLDHHKPRYFRVFFIRQCQFILVSAYPSYWRASWICGEVLPPPNLSYSMCLFVYCLMCLILGKVRNHFHFIITWQWQEGCLFPCGRGGSRGWYSTGAFQWMDSKHKWIAFSSPSTFPSVYIFFCVSPGKIQPVEINGTELKT